MVVDSSIEIIDTAVDGILKFQVLSLRMIKLKLLKNKMLIYHGVQVGGDVNSREG